jgi:hypothetical protein
VELEAYLKQQAAARRDLQKQIADLSRQREQYLAEERKKLAGKKDGFDEEMAKILHGEIEDKGLVAPSSANAE